MRLHLLVLLLVACWSPYRLVAADAIAPGDPVPAAVLTTLTGLTTSLAELRGDGPLVLMAWCSSCHSCRGVEQAFDRFATACRGQIPVIALASNPSETSAAVQDRQTQGGLGFPVVLDPAGALVDACGVHSTTTALVIAADGTLAFRGPFSEQGQVAVRDALRELAAGRQPTVREIEQQGCPIR